MSFSRAAVVIVVEVELDGLPAWDEGPLPVGAGETAEARRSYLNQRAAQALYGRSRRHSRAAAPPGAPGAFEPAGVEILCFERGASGVNGLLAVHGHLPGGGAALVDDLARLADLGPGSPARAWFELVLADAGQVAATRRATTLVMTTPSGELTHGLPEPYAGWGPELEWLWLLASATPADRYLPPLGMGAALESSVVHLSAGWRALVLRDGSAFLGSGPDMSSVYGLAADPEVHFRSIYLDAILLGMVQRLRLGAIADDLATLSDPADHPDRLAELEHELAGFRNAYWWRHLGSQWHGTEILRAYQRQHEIPDLLDQVVGQLGDSARVAQTGAAQRTEALVGLLTVVGLPLGLAVATLHALEVTGWKGLLVSLAAATVVTVAILLSRPGRSLVRLWRTVGRSDRQPAPPER